MYSKIAILAFYRVGYEAKYKCAHVLTSNPPGILRYSTIGKPTASSIGNVRLASGPSAAGTRSGPAACHETIESLQLERHGMARGRLRPTYRSVSRGLIRSRHGLLARWGCTTAMHQLTDYWLRESD
jgi:hypothetical protein